MQSQLSNYIFGNTQEKRTTNREYNDELTTELTTALAFLKTDLSVVGAHIKAFVGLTDLFFSWSMRVGDKQMGGEAKHSVAPSRGDTRSRLSAGRARTHTHSLTLSLSLCLLSL